MNKQNKLVSSKDQALQAHFHNATLQRYQGLMELVDQLKAGEAKLIDYETPNETRRVKEFLYTYWEITGMKMLRKINSITDTQICIADTRSKPINKTKYNIDEIIQYLSAVPVLAQEYCQTFALKFKLIAIDDLIKIETALEQSQGKQSQGEQSEQVFWNSTSQATFKPLAEQVQSPKDKQPKASRVLQESCRALDKKYPVKELPDINPFTPTGTGK